MRSSVNCLLLNFSADILNCFHAFLLFCYVYITKWLYTTWDSIAVRIRVANKMKEKQQAEEICVELLIWIINFQINAFPDRKRMKWSCCNCDSLRTYSYLKITQPSCTGTNTRQTQSLLNWSEWKGCFDKADWYIYFIWNHLCTIAI